MTTSHPPAEPDASGQHVSHGPITKVVVFIVMASARMRYAVLALALVLTAFCSWYAANNFAINTNTDDFIASTVPWRQNEIAYQKAFPDQENQIIAVVDGKTPERASEAVAALFTKLQGHPDLFKAVVEPDGGPFFAKNGLLFQSTEDVQKAIGGLQKAQPVLAIIGSDASLRGVFDGFGFIVKGVDSKQGTFDQFDQPVVAMNAALDKILADKPALFSWQNLISNGEKPNERQLRKFIMISPVLDYSALEPGEKPTTFVRDAAKSLALDPSTGVTVRLTGQVPISDSEFATVADGFGLNGAITGVVVLLIIYSALKSLKIVAAVFVTVLAGLAMTFAAGLALVGALNLISVAFAVLFVGIGVDFGIQFSVRYKAERYDYPDFYDALAMGAAKVGRPLALAAAATTAGFYAFLPTAYLGVSELGEIAGTGMIIAFLCSITILPALLTVIKPPPEREPAGYKFLAPVDDFIEKHRYVIIIGTLAVALAGTPLLRNLHFDFNPLNLDSQTQESVSTLIDLMKDPNTDTQVISVLEPSLAQADATGAKLSKLPDVARVTTLSNLVPEDQDQKLAVIAQGRKALGPALDPSRALDAPPDEDDVEAIRKTASAFAGAAQNLTGKGADDARTFATLANRLADAPPQIRQRARAVLIPPLKTTVATIRDTLEASKVTIADIPQSLKDLYVTPTGVARVEVAPKGDPRRQRQHDPLRQGGAVRRAQGDRAARLHPGGRQDGEAGLHRGRRHRARLDLRHPVDRAEARRRRAADAGAAAARRRGHAGDHGADRHAVELRQHHRAAAAPRPRRRLQDLLRAGLARRHEEAAAVEPDARRLLERFDDGDRLWEPVGVQAPRHLQSMGKLMALSLVCTLAAAILFQPALMGPPRKTEIS